MLSTHEQSKMKDIERKLDEMRVHLSKDEPALDNSAAWFAYLAELKAIQGNASNDVSFVATLLAKEYLAQHYGLTDFDAAEKPQSAPGIDIDVHLPDGRRLVAELKTTNPYKEKDFGAMQRKTIKNLSLNFTLAPTYDGTGKEKQGQVIGDFLLPANQQATKAIDP